MFHDQNYRQELPRDRIEYLRAEYRRADVREGDRVDDRRHAVISVSTDDASDFVYASKGMRLRLMWAAFRPLTISVPEATAHEEVQRPCLVENLT